METVDEKLMQNAQYRKSLSIAFFNATNAAIEIVKKGIGTSIFKDNNDVKKTIVEWRNWLLEEHKNYYATVISNVGKNYNAEDSIAKLRSAKTIEELKVAWRMLSEDERHDGSIIAETKSLKAKFDKAGKEKNEKK